MARTKSKMFGGKHLQHTKSFQNELNSINTRKQLEPIRISDEVWIVGKYKNTKIKLTPVSYIRWSYNNMKMSNGAKLVLEKYLDK